jgi:hypothetical protein
VEKGNSNNTVLYYAEDLMCHMGRHLAGFYEFYNERIVFSSFSVWSKSQKNSPFATEDISI